MTLTTHAVVGAAIASLIPEHPVAGFLAAFASHFLIDAIPHYDYPIASPSVNPQIGTAMKYDKALAFDTLFIGTDTVLGILLSLVLFLPSGSFWIILLGASAGILPDPLQFIYAHFRHEPLVMLQRFHLWIHTDKKLQGRPLIGISSQIAFLLAVAALARLLIK